MEDGVDATPDQLAQRLAQAAKANPETEIQLRADQAVPYGRVVEVMDIARGANVARMAIAVKPKQESK